MKRVGAILKAAKIEFNDQILEKFIRNDFPDMRSIMNRVQSFYLQGVKELNPEIVLFDRFMVEEQFGWRVTECCPDALKILDTEDLHCLRQARQVAVKENREFTLNDLYSDVAKREIASILRCDLTLMVSEFEINLLQL